MINSFKFLLTIFPFLTLVSYGQSPTDNAYLLRKLIDKDSSVRVPNTGVWILENAGLKKQHFGWLLLAIVGVPPSFASQSQTSVRAAVWSPTNGNTSQEFIICIH